MKSGRWSMRSVGVAIAAVALGLASRELLWVIGGVRVPYLLFFPWMFAAVFAGGSAAGWLSLVGFIAVSLFWMEPTTLVPTRAPIIGLVIFAGGSVMLLICAQWANRLQARLRQAHAVLRESEERLRLITDSLPALIAYVDSQERYLFASQAYETWVGMPREKIIGLRIRDIAPNEQMYQTIKPHIDAALAGEPRKFSSRMLYADGVSRDVDVTYSPDVGQDGTVRGFAVMVIDVSERRKSEDALRASEDRYRALAEAVPDFMWSCAADGRVEYLNPRYVEYTGVTLETVNEGGWHRAVHVEDHAAIEKAWMKTLAEKTAFELEYRFRNQRDGEYRWFLTRTVPMRGSDGQVVRWVGAATDVHDSKLARQERERLLAAERAAREESERAGRIKDEFLAVLSHELRTPLTPVLMTVSLLETNADLPAALREDIASIRRSIELEARLIDDLLDLTRLARGKIRYDFQPVDLHMLIRSAMSICCNDGKLHVVSDFGAAESFVNGDAARLQQVFWNLFNNAWKFTPPGGKVTVTTRSENGRVKVSVSDTGAGIDPELLPRVFDAFEQGDVTRARNFGGLGLGLAICKALVAAHGGAISARSEGIGRGAAFVVDLPTAARPVQVKPTPAKPMMPRPDTQSLRMLLVEDHPDTRTALSRLLKSVGHEVDCAASVADGLRIAAQGKYDLLISDLGLPDGSGYELMRELQRQYGLRGIALSGYGMEEDVQRSRQAGFAEHLVKPIDLQKLREAIERVTKGGWV